MTATYNNILVTGGAGFIGSHLVDALILQGLRVFVVDNLSSGKRENVNPKATFYEMNLEDRGLEAILKQEKPDAVFHLACNTNVPKSVQDPMFDATSILASVNVFHAAQLAGVRKIIFASSSFIYGNNEKLPFTEEHPFLPVSPYAVSKMASENYLQFFHQTYGIPAVILRYGTVYGPRQVGGAMADYIRKISAGTSAEMFGDGMLTRDYLYIDDIIRANLLALQLEAPAIDSCPVLNIGSETEVTLNDVYAVISSLLGKPENKPTYLPPRPGELQRFCVSYQQAKKTLGWTPTVKLEEGILRILKYKKLL